MTDILKVYSKLTNKDFNSLSEELMISRSDFSSVMFDRFIAELKKHGVKWDGSVIKFTNLISTPSNESKVTITPIQKTEYKTALVAPHIGDVGVDMEQVENLPDAIDFWEDSFYVENFSKEEIAHCVIKKYPKESFAGIYACKEALIKADNTLKSRSSFSQIEILFNKDGKPYYPNFSISISHSNGTCIALAIAHNMATSGIYNTSSMNAAANQNPIEDIKMLHEKKRRFVAIVLTGFLLLFIILLIYNRFNV
jgi:phosphopantetheine--protein transferase-like protein